MSVTAHPTSSPNRPRQRGAILNSGHFCSSRRLSSSNRLSRRLVPQRHALISNPPRIQTNDPTTRAVLGYLAANCAMCHDGSDGVAVLGPSLKYADLMEDADLVARNLVERPSNWQAPGQSDGSTRLVHPGDPERSALLLRMRSRSPSSQMPPLGTVVRDQRAVDAITRWIRER